MQKFLGLGCFAIALMIADAVLAQGAYVRKRVEPDFFMPESAKTQPEKLPMPKYYKGQEETIKNAKPEPEVRRLPPVAAEETIESDGEVEVNDGVLNEMENAPDYQQKYEDYSNDLEQIDQTGEIPANDNLKNDLQQMNSTNRRIVKRKPYQTRNPKVKFDKALNEALF